MATIDFNITLALECFTRFGHLIILSRGLRYLNSVYSIAIHLNLFGHLGRNTRGNEANAFILGDIVYCK